jgi:hypothetical protein
VHAPAPWSLALFVLLAACSATPSEGGPKDGSTPTVEGPVSPPTSPEATEPTEPTDPTEPQVEPPTSHVYPATDGPDKNPLKGWNAGWWDDYPESSVGFQYLAWGDIEPQDGVLDAAQIEEVIARPGSKDRHLILRVYCQWFEEESVEDTACPLWLSESPYNVPFLEGDGGTGLWDFNDAAFLSQAVELIDALGEQFDDDPRIFTIQIGIIGYWGEWHTVGFEQDGVDYEFTDTTTQTVLDAYQASFTNKRVVGRYPWREPLASAGWIGFHNDYFLANNDHSQEFDDSVAAGNKWREGPIGGETPPGAELGLYDDDEGLSMIETAHYSTMGPGGYHREKGDDDYEAYMSLHRRMGYNFQISEALFPVEAAASSSLSVVVTGANIGVAPFYYDWDVEFALLDDSDAPAASAKSSVALSTILDGAPFEFDAALPLDEVAPGSYRVAIRLVQPGAADAKDAPWGLDASNVTVLFANELTVIPGAWDGQNAFVGGWSVLGDVAVTAGTR